MKLAYPGPLRGQPLPIELHNTLYAGARGARHDGIATPAALIAWLHGVDSSLPVPADLIDPNRLPDFHTLRDAVRAALHAGIDHKPIPHDARRRLNEASAACPRSTQMTHDGTRRIRYHADDPATTALAAIAHETIALVTSPQATHRLRVCGAPGCVLMFTSDHPRRAWCSPGCGNRARQARHYARHRH